jgi:carbon-monoxide dehydrogenase medium subunit
MTEQQLFKPKTVEEAVRLLSEAGEEGRALSGGATLVAMMNARLVEARVLVSLSAIPELREATRQPDGTVRIGAMRRHRQTAEETDLRGGQRVLSHAAGQIANPPVRNMGTIGGSISFADPAADYPPALVAVGARVEIAGPEGRRDVAAEEFFHGWYMTDLAPGEIVTAVLVPPAAEGSVGHYEKLARVAGDFALASVALTLSLAPDGRIAALRMGIGGCGGGPVRVPEAEAALVGHDPQAPLAPGTAEMIRAALDPVDDVRGSADYRLKVAPRLVGRALRLAASDQLKEAS